MKEIYEIQLDLYGDFEREENPTFIVNEVELVTMMQFFFDNGYNLFVKRLE